MFDLHLLKFKLTLDVLTFEDEGIILDTNTSITMVTDPVVMVISITVTNKERVISLIAPTSDCRKILIYQETISVYNFYNGWLNQVMLIISLHLYHRDIRGTQNELH